MKVAVVGTGIAGLTTGWLLNRAGHDVTLLERLPSLGMDAHAENFLDGETRLRADLPPRMFNRSLWPNLFRLYETLDVAIDPVDPSKSFGGIDGPTDLVFGRSFFSSLPLKSLFNSNARQIARDIRRMNLEVPTDLANDRVQNVDFMTYLKQRHYSNAFIFRFVFPALASTVCTCSYNCLKSYPAIVLLQAMLLLTNREGLYRARLGAADVVRRLTKQITDIRCNAHVKRAVPTESGVAIELVSGSTFDVDHLIVATQANSATRFLPEMTTQERAMLDSFVYEDVDVVLHRDESMMPKRRSDWAHFNMLFDNSNSAAMCTVWMNRFCPEWKLSAPLFQTISPVVDPAPDLVICRRRLQRPIVNRESILGLKLLADLHKQSDRRIWFCGSYASPGIPLLESGVVSSMNVVRSLNVRLPDSLAFAEA